MPILSNGRLLVVDVDTPEEKQLIGLYWGVGIQSFIETGEDDKLRRFKRFRIQGHPLDVDPDRIEDFYRDTDFDFQELYEP